MSPNETTMAYRLSNSPEGTEDTPIVACPPSKPLEDFWVTVFGFPPSTTSYVLQQFKLYGDVIQYEIGETNWMHLQYATRLQAQKALTRNGHVFGDSLLIGVVPSRKVGEDNNHIV
jgi:hypothetical protein